MANPEESNLLCFILIEVSTNNEQGALEQPSSLNVPSNELQELRAMLVESHRQIARLTKSNTTLTATVMETREAVIKLSRSDPIQERSVSIDDDRTVNVTDTPIPMERRKRNAIVLFRTSAEWPVFQVSSPWFVLFHVLYQAIMTT